MILLNRRWQQLISLVCYIIISPKENDNEFVNAFAFSPNSSTGISTKTVLQQRHAATVPVTVPVPVTLSSSFRTSSSMSTRLNVAGGSTDDFPIDLTKSFVLTKEEVAPLVQLNKESGKEKWINAYGILFIVASIITAPIWWSAMAVTDAVCNAFPDLDPNRKFYDKTGKIWSKVFLTMTNSFPGITGDVDRLRESDNDDDGSEKQACLYVANHASWLDIPVLCTVLSPVFKFISKAELLSVPCIGKQLTGGNHILIDREDRRSQLRTFKEGVAWLNKGVPLMAFPEGQRSDDGKLLDFKGGIFSMAVRAKVPIVPISVANTHAVMPSNALFPFQAGAGKLHVHVHPPIDIEGKSESELADLVRTALLSKMPLDQHPLPKVTEGSDDDDDDTEVSSSSNSNSAQLKKAVEKVVPEIVHAATSAHATHAAPSTHSTTIVNEKTGTSNDLQQVE